MHKDIEVYVDDMIAKPREGENHIQMLKDLSWKTKEVEAWPHKVFIRGEIWKVVGIYDEWKKDRSGPWLSKGYSIYANS